ncbi:MAG: DUF835 domain-containing protein [Thermoplasmatota archaeon]
MSEWHFISWTLQYLAAIPVIMGIAIYIFIKNKETPASKSFFLSGLMFSIWQISVFIHRNAPSLDISRLFFGLALFATMVGASFLLVCMFYIYDEDKPYYLLILLFLPTASIALVFTPFDIMWSNFGWTYSFDPRFTNLYYLSALGQIVGMSYITVRAWKMYPEIKRKLSLILFAWVGINSIGVMGSNLWLSSHPQFPPLSGILNILTFLIIAYAINLPREKITSSKKIISDLSPLMDRYLDFLNTYRESVPGKELGEYSFRFEDHLEAMGLSDVVSHKRGQVVFDKDALEYMTIEEVPDNIMRVIKNQSWACKVIDEYKDIFQITYSIIRERSKFEAVKWANEMIKFHGPYLYHEGILEEVSGEVDVPDIYEELKPGTIGLYTEKEPVKVYDLVEKARDAGFHCLCLSKYKHMDIENGEENIVKLKFRYEPSKMSIYRITSKDSGKNISPNNINKLNEVISDFVENNYIGVVVIDSLDQILFANGIDSTLRFLKKVVGRVEGEDTIFLLSLDLDLFGGSDLEKIRKVLSDD